MHGSSNPFLFYCPLHMEILPILAAAGVVEGLTETASSIKGQFGLQSQLFISQAIGFLIFAGVLYRFAFKPIQSMLDERRNRIIEGEEKLKHIEKQLAESEANTAAAIAKANSEAVRLIDEAKTGAAAFTEQKAQEAIASAQLILTKAEAAAKADRNRLEVELKREFGRLVAQTTTQVTGKILNADDQKRINEDALARVEA
jgi:F-type H+-transporting ATPase subunit b